MVASWMAIGRSLLASGIKRISSGRQSHAEWRFHRSWPRIWPSYMSLASGSLFANKTPSIHKYTSSSYFPQVEVIEVVGFKVGLGGVGLNFHIRTEFYRMTERCSDWVDVNYCEVVKDAGAVDKQLPRSVGSSRVELTMQTSFEDKRLIMAGLLHESSFSEIYKPFNICKYSCNQAPCGSAQTPSVSFEWL